MDQFTSQVRRNHVQFLKTLERSKYKIYLYSPSCLDQETEKELFGFQVKLPPAHLSATRQLGKMWIPIFSLSLTRPGIEPACTVLVADARYGQ